MEISCQQIHLEHIRLIYNQINPNYFVEIKDYFQSFQQVPTWEEYFNNHSDHIFILNKEKNEKNSSPIQGWDNQIISCLNYTCLFYCLKNRVHPLKMNKRNWSEIGSYYFNLQWKRARSRWLQQQSQSIIQQPWSREEDLALFNIQNQMMKQGKCNKWRQVSIELGLKCETNFVRQGKQCRERWINQLNPILEKGPWYKDEELLLFQAVYMEGKKWTKISAKYFKDKRSGNALKNRFYSIYNKEIKKHKIESLKQELQYKLILKELKHLQPSNLLLKYIKEYQYVPWGGMRGDNWKIAIIKRQKIYFL